MSYQLTSSLVTDSSERRYSVSFEEVPDQVTEAGTVTPGVTFRDFVVGRNAIYGVDSSGDSLSGSTSPRP